MSATAELTIAGLEPTGRRLKCPASELVELKDPNDDDALLHTAIVYEEQYQGHPALTENVRLALNFMEAPMVAGLIDLSKHDLDAGWYLYPTGATRTMQEVLKAYRDIGQAPGLRAALEMCYLAGMAIVEAGESGPTQGVFSHGDISPNRVLVTADGQIQVIGHAIPQIEILEWRNNNDHVVREESFRYCPPERIEGTMEDPTSDLYCLTLMAYEMITGKDLFQGSLADIIQAARTAEGPNLLAKAAKTKGKGKGNVKLPAAVREWMEMSLQFDPSIRLQGHDYINALYELLSDPSLEGETMFDIAKRVFGSGRKGRALTSAGTTEAIPRRALQAASSGLGIRAPGGRFVAGGRRRDGDSDDEQGEESRWGSVSRGPARRGEEEEEGSSRRRRRRRGASDDAEDEPKAEEGTSRRRRRRRGGSDEAEEEPKAEEGTSRRRRRRRGASDDDDSEAEEPQAKEEEEEEKPARRRRRRGSSDDDKEEEKAKEEPKEEEEEKPARRRRRRGSSDDDKEEEKAKEEPKEEEEEKPARRRRRRGSSDDDKEEEKAKEAPKEEPKEEEKPARRRRRRGSSDDDTKAADKADEPAEDAAPARRRRRRTPKK